MTRADGKCRRRAGLETYHVATIMVKDLVPSGIIHGYQVWGGDVDESQEICVLFKVSPRMTCSFQGEKSSHCAVEKSDDTLPGWSVLTSSVRGGWVQDTLEGHTISCAVGWSRMQNLSLIAKKQQRNPECGTFCLKKNKKNKKTPPYSSKNVSVVRQRSLPETPDSRVYRDMTNYFRDYV